MPGGMAEDPIPDFPTPGKTIRRLAAGSKRTMLERLYLDYRHLCSFAHGLQGGNMAKTVYDTRSSERRLFSEADIQKTFDAEVNTPARVYSLLSIVQSVAELKALYPNDMELVSSTTNAWIDMIDSQFTVNAVWNLRTKDLLGAI
jgi:hypothetical protein